MAYKETVLAASAARTTTGEGSVVETIPNVDAGHVGEKTRFNLNVSAASGTTPTLDVTLVGVVNGIEYTIGTFTQKTGVIKDTITVDAAPNKVKAKWTIGGGTPSFTFEVTASRN